MSTTAAAHHGPGSVRWQRDDDGLVMVTFDDPAARTNMITPRHVAGMHDLLAYLDAGFDDIRGVVLTSAKQSFFSGPEFDPAELPSQEGGTYDHVIEVRDQLRRLETFGRPVAVALNGSALGGGFEIALAGHYRVGLDNDGIRWALAEATTGILPAGGGTVRVARGYGLATAVREIVGAGVAYSPAMGLARGLIEELASTPAEVLAAARRWVVQAGPDGGGQRWEKPNFRVPGGLPGEVAFEIELAAIRSEIEALTDPTKEARQAVLDVTLTALGDSLQAAFDAETAAFRRLVALPQTRQLGLVFAGLKRIHDRISQAHQMSGSRLAARDVRTFDLARRNPLIDVFLPDCPDRIVELVVPDNSSDQVVADLTAAAAPLGVPIIRRGAPDALDQAVLTALSAR